MVDWLMDTDEIKMTERGDLLIGNVAISKYNLDMLRRVEDMAAHVFDAEVAAMEAWKIESAAGRGN
jgi:hypothetical protein